MKKRNFGKVFQEKRKERGYTQKQVAEMIHVSDKAISRWETNKSVPEFEMMEIISKALKVDLTELVDCKITENDAAYEAIIKELKKKNSKLKTKLEISLIIFLIIIILLSLAIFFVSTFNKFKVYNVSLSGDEIFSSYGIYVDTHYENILNLGQVYFNNEPINDGEINIYAMDKDKRIDVIKNESLTANNQFILNKKLGDMVNNNYLDSLYLELIVNEEIYTAKVDFMKRFANNKLIYTDKSFEIKNNFEINKEEIIKTLNNLGFTKENDYTYINNDKHLKYTIGSRKLFYEYKDDNLLYKYDYSFNSKNLNVQILVIKNEKIVTLTDYNYNFDEKDLNCKIGYCSDYEDVINELNPYIKALS